MDFFWPFRKRKNLQSLGIRTYDSQGIIHHDQTRSCSSSSMHRFSPFEETSAHSRRLHRSKPGPRPKLRGHQATEQTSTIGYFKWTSHKSYSTQTITFPGVGKLCPASPQEDEDKAGPIVPTEDVDVKQQCTPLGSLLKLSLESSPE
jgi:hypothetical protein